MKPTHLPPNDTPLRHPDPRNINQIAAPNSDRAQWCENGLQYTIAAAIFIIYGIQVCPFLDTLERPFFVSVILLLFGAMFFTRSLIVNALKIHFELKTQFILDNSLFFSGSILLAIGNYYLYAFPLESSVRVILGFMMLGFFISIQLTLQAEHRLIKNRHHRSAPTGKYKPIAFKVQTLTLALLTGSILTMLLIIYKDFEWLKDIGHTVSLQQASLWILYEFIFVSSVFIGYGMLIIHRFSRNLNLYFLYQNTVLEAIEQGQRNIAVPIISNDEFSTMAKYTNHMINSLQHSEQTLKQTRDATILAISSLAETRDNETGAHILRTQYYVKALGDYLQKTPSFNEKLTQEDLELIYKSASLHDIGKVGIPDNILLKPGKLTDDEFAIMKKHPIIGRQAIEKAEQTMGELPFLYYAKEISESHHEKWDGSGYPHGLKGTAIPLSGRLMALADVYDALITRRVYKPAFSHEKAKDIIIKGRGHHFDPNIVDAFLALEDDFIAIAKKYSDKKSSAPEF